LPIASNTCESHEFRNAKGWAEKDGGGEGWERSEEGELMAHEGSAVRVAFGKCVTKVGEERWVEEEGCEREYGTLMLRTICDGSATLLSTPTDLPTPHPGENGEGRVVEPPEANLDGLLGMSLR
jgi:hypothetical protein